MELFKFQYPMEELPDTRELYYRANDDVIYNNKGDEKKLVFRKGADVCFDTYFNCFSYAKYLRYTYVKKINIKLELNGSFAVRVFARRAKNYVEQREDWNRNYHSTKFDECICEEFFDGNGTVSIPLNFEKENEFYEGFYYVKLTALSDDAEFLGGRYCSMENAYNDVNVAIAICTFRREQFVIGNVLKIRDNLLVDHNSSVQDNLEVNIIDNGKTLDEAIFNNSKIHVIPNKNFGGAGGFTRGIIEALYNKDRLSHVLLLDDDVLINTECIAKTINFLKIVRKEHKDLYVAAGMIPLDEPTFQFEATSKWDGVYHNLKKFDLRNPISMLWNEYEEPADYGSWYYQCIPLQVISESNLPLPIFIKFDDMEYSMRNMKKCLVMNGICIWHEAFDKKYSPTLDYYYTRNHLILNHTKGISKSAGYDLKDLWINVIKNLCLQRYDAAEMYIRGLKDYMKGTEFFKERDDEKLHQEIMASCVKFKTREQLLKEGIQYHSVEEKVKSGIFKKIISRMLLNGHLIPYAFQKNTLKTVELNDVSLASVFRYKKVLHWNSGDNRGFVTELSYKKFWSAIFRLLGLSFVYIFKWKNIEKDFVQNFESITNLEYWERHLGINA